MYYSQFNDAFTKNVRISFDNGFNEMMESQLYAKIFAVADTTEMLEKFNSTESTTLPQEVGESQTVPYAKLSKWYSTFHSGKGYADRIVITAEDRVAMKDNTTVFAELLARERNRVLLGFQKKIEINAHERLNNAFTGGSTGSYIYGGDLKPLIATDHAWNSTGWTFSNKLASQDLNVDAVRLLEQTARKFTDANGVPLPLQPDTVIVKAGSTAAFQAKQLFGINMGQYSPTTLGNVNIFQGSAYTLVETPYIQNVQDGSGNDKSDKAYFFVDSRYMGNNQFGNPLFLHFEKRPALEGELFQTSNLDREYSFYGHWKMWIRNLPYAWFGSVWA